MCLNTSINILYSHVFKYKSNLHNKKWFLKLFLKSIQRKKQQYQLNINTI